MQHQSEHLSDATITVIMRLRQLSAELAIEPDWDKRYHNAIDYCRRQGTNFGLDPYSHPSPLMQMIDSWHSAIRAAEYDEIENALVLYPWPVAQPSISLPWEWFDDALLNVETHWGFDGYPYGK